MKQSPKDVIFCRVVVLDCSSEAVCSMVVGGREVPRVSFPAWVLRQKGLQVGDRFRWIVRDSELVQPVDIVTDVSQSDEMTPAEKDHLEALHAEFQRDLAKNGGQWPVYTGDGE